MARREPNAVIFLMITVGLFHRSTAEGRVMARIKIDDTLNAFCKDTDAYLEGASDGPLTGLPFAAKDILDVAGYVTGAGNPD